MFWSIVSSIFDAKFSIRIFSAPLNVSDVKFFNLFPANLRPNKCVNPVNIPSENSAISFSPKSNVLSAPAKGVSVESTGKYDIRFAANDRSWTDVQSSNVFLENRITTDTNYNINKCLALGKLD